ncbi:MAG: ribosome recycling factor [Candidatus Paceibacterota bacterium]
MLNTVDIKDKFNKIIESFKKDIQSLRTGEASIDLVDSLLVEYYGTPTPLKQIAAISIPEPRVIMITPWDKSSIAGIDKAIQKATHLGLNPISESAGVRLVIPVPTEERRLALVKELNHKSEDFKTELRQLRDEARNTVKTQLKNKEISEDDQYKDFEQIDLFTKEYQTELELISKKKEQQILTI